MSSLNVALSFQAKEDRLPTISSKPTVLVSWGFEELEHDADVDELSRKPPWGAVVGCVDGSIYIFRPDLSKPTRRKSQVFVRRFSGSNDLAHPHSRRPPHLSLSRSRNVSPSGSRTNLAVTSTSKSRAVSGLSKEQAEAPKNFVDFEDEQERMKGMISERAVKDMKDRSPRSSLAPGFESSRRFDDARSVASVESSSTMHSPPLSPTLEPSSFSGYRKHLLLRTRIIPEDFGLEHPIVSLSILEEGELVLALQESGKVSVFKSIDGACIVSAEPGAVPALFKSTVMSHGTGAQLLWSWISICVARLNDSILIVAIAKADDRTVALDNGESDDKTRIAVFELANAHEHEFGDTTLVKVGDVVLDGCAESFAVCQDTSRTIKLYQVDGSLKLTTRVLSLPPPPIPVSSARPVRRDSPMPAAGLRLPQSIRNIVSRSDQHLAIESGQSSLRVDLQPGHEIGSLPLAGPVKGLRVRQVGKNITSIAWSANELIVFTLRDSTTVMRSILPLQPGLKNAEVIDPNVVQLVYANRVEMYGLPDSTATKSSDSIGGKPLRSTTTLISSIPLATNEVVCSSGDNIQRRLSLRVDADVRQISVLHGRSPKDGFREKSKAIWSAPFLDSPRGRKARRITALLPIDLTSIIVGYDDGLLSRQSLEKLVHSQSHSSDSIESVNYAILSLFVVKNVRTDQKFVVGGGDDGSVNVWDLSTLHVQARWVLFTEPLAHVIPLEDEAAGRLRGCCFCVSGDGTIAVIAIDGFNFLYLIPGSPSRLQTLCLGSDNLMLFYIDGRTRLWDVKTREFWRSMSSDKAAEMLAQGGWFTSDIEDERSRWSNASISALNKSEATGNPSPVSIVDVQTILNSFARKPTKTNDEVDTDYLRTLLASLYSFGLDEALDRLVSDFLRLGGAGSATIVGAIDIRLNHQSYFLESLPAAWQISPEVTAMRLLSIVALIHALLNVTGFEEPANMMLSFYTVALPSVIGTNYQAPSLAILAQYWNESMVVDIRFAAKHLFENEIARLPDDVLTAVVEKWQHKLPCLLPEDQRQSSKAALALNICGNIATEKYTLLSATTLSDVAKSVTIYFNDDTSPHRVLAIELCSRGFEIWQQYFDAMEALRSLFTLATTTRKETISVRNPGPQARMAVLQIASSNSPLFVTTLSLDILHPRSIEYSKSVLQIIAFLIRKKPLVLYPNLPRLMEAVVKSLDPGSNAEREAVLDSVTEIIALVVQTFPTLDFHAVSQRLAVGTSEGAVIMYDLKTATRLYVLEGHRKRLAGISFSPDGRRMVTLSVEESVVLVWKVGTSFTSFFNPGAPPRQGRSGSDPYKTLSFVLQEQATMTVESALKQVSFEWPSDRSVRVQIREAVFTFST